jgi:dTDP-4-amino-4,6-dideoxygalactose transaminase
MKGTVKNSRIRVPFFIPNITKDDKREVLNALDKPILTDGPKLREFEKVFAEFVGTKFAIGVSNATSALFLSLKALEIKKGDEVIIPNETFVATANAVLHTGATPVLADVEEDGYNISVNSIRKNISSKTKIILPVHIAGKACNIREIKKIAKAKNIQVIEDCAHAIGASINGKHVGTFGECGCFSFYPTKNITTIEGGMIVTNSRKIADKIRINRNHGLTKSLLQRFSKGKPWDYDVIIPGYNYRIDELRSTLGINQMKRIKKLNLLRREKCRYYNTKLKKIKGIKTPNLTEKNDDVNHLYMIRVQKEFGTTRDKLFSKLLELGVSTSLHYKPLHKFTAYKKLAVIRKSLENSEQLYKEIISLPLFPDITKKEQDYVIKCIKDICFKNMTAQKKGKSKQSVKS